MQRVLVFAVVTWVVYCFALFLFDLLSVICGFGAMYYCWFYVYASG